jgi:transcriptional regulator with XRE-family HTH domain
VADWNPETATIGERIRRRRQELGLSQRQLGSLGVSYAYISRLEADQRRPSVKALRQIAPKIEVSVHWLETGREDPAETLARLVLETAGNPLPPHASTLAREILASSDHPEVASADPSA